MKHERLVAVGGYFDGMLMAPTAVGLPNLRMPIPQRTMATVAVLADSEPVQMRTEEYRRGILNTPEKNFAVWMATSITYEDMIGRLLSRYCYERDSDTQPKAGDAQQGSAP